MIQIQSGLQQFRSAGEGMENGDDPAMRPQRRRCIRVRFPGVDYCWPSSLRGDLELTIKHAALHIPRRVIVVVVESHLSGGNDPLIPENVAEPFVSFGTPEAGLMRVKPCSGRDPGMGPRKFQCSGASIGGFANHYRVPEPGFPGPGKNLRSVPVKSAGCQVAMGVNQHPYATGWVLRRAGREEDDLLLRVP